MFLYQFLFLCLRSCLFSKRNLIAQASGPSLTGQAHCHTLRNPWNEKLQTAKPAGIKRNGGPWTRETYWRRALRGGSFFSSLFSLQDLVYWSAPRVRTVCVCSHTDFTDGPNHHQGASSSRHSTPGFLKPRQPGLDSSPPAATKTQEPWFPDCLDFPKYFGSRPNCHSSTGLRIEPGISYPLPVFKINLSSKDKYVFL